MKATLKLEVFGDNTRQHLKLWESVVNEVLPGVGSALIGKYPSSCWVAEIVGPDAKFGFDRQFVKPRKDYSKANSVGSRGVYNWYVIESGRYYEVKEQTSWRRGDRYFIKVTENGDVQRVAKSEVEQWLKNRLA